jgi:hypothetical protein
MIWTAHRSSPVMLRNKRIYAARAPVDIQPERPLMRQCSDGTLK